MATAWELLASNSHLKQGINTTAIKYLQNSVKFIKATTLSVKDDKVKVNTADKLFSVSTQDATDINISVTDVSINIKDNANVNTTI